MSVGKSFTWIRSGEELQNGVFGLKEYELFKKKRDRQV